MPMTSLPDYLLLPIYLPPPPLNITFTKCDTKPHKKNTLVNITFAAATALSTSSTLAKETFVSTLRIEKQTKNKLP